MAVEETASRFDLVVLHDVLEHIPDVVGALQQVTKLVRPCVFLFISFPPYYSAFGGHQQLARGRSRVIPFIHLLPERAFFRLAHPGDQEYMSSQDSLADMVSVRRSRLTLRKIERALSRTPLSWVDRELFVIRPEYGVRYGLKTRSARGLGKVPGLREFVINGAFYLAQRRGRE